MNKKVIVFLLGMSLVVVAGFFLVRFLGGTRWFRGVSRSSQNSQVRAGEAQEAEGHYLLARDLYKKAFAEDLDSETLERVRDTIENLNLKILFSPEIDPDSVSYTVRPGDSLEKIASKHSTTVALLKRANGLSSDIIRAGSNLKVTTIKFSILVDRSQNVLFLKKGDEVFKTYVVSTGENLSTPLGVFKIISKLPNPVWYNKDVGAAIPAGSPENYLGSRWMGLDLKGYGIHGTTDPQNIGKHITKGCVRMKNEEVEELFDIVPVGTEVTIIE